MTLEEKVQAVMGKLLMDTCMQATNLEQLQAQVDKLKGEATTKCKEAEGNA